MQDELTARVGEEFWAETIRLYTAEADATPILEACLQDDPPRLQALVLALEAWVQYYAGAGRSERVVYEDSFLGTR